MAEYEALTQQLAKLNQEKTRYLLQATHQLKAPFAAIQSYVDIILEGYTGAVEGRTRAIMYKIRRRCERLAGAIKEMLELAHLKTSASDEISMEPTPLRSILGEAVERHKIIAEQRNIVVHYTPPPGDWQVYCDPKKVTVLFAILLDNAIQYSSDNSSVLIGAHCPRPEVVTVVVEDHGIGIAEEQLPRIFDEYYRTNEAAAANDRGTGLGLSIVREIVKLHGFSIQTQSTVGKGTTMAVTMPRCSS